MCKQDALIPGAVAFFLFGIVFYLVSQVFDFFSGNRKLLNFAKKYLNPTHFSSNYVLDAIAILLSFLFKYGLGRAVPRSKPSTADHGTLKAGVQEIFVLSFGKSIMDCAVSDRPSGAVFFADYSTSDIGVHGSEYPCTVRSSIWRC